MGIRPNAITFDFGNTLVPIGREDMQLVVERTATRIAAQSGPFATAAFVDAWRAERARQFAEDIPAGREVDIEQRAMRVLARLRGLAPPRSDGRWDDEAAARLSEPRERAAAVDAYCEAFVTTVPVPPDVEPLLGRLAARHRLGVLSNWPLAISIDRFLDAAGWARHLRVIVVSQRVGMIKPDPAIFRVAEAGLGVPAKEILHVGDDWYADVVGAKRAGWLAAYLEGGQAGSPLPSSSPDDSVKPDLMLHRLTELEPLLDR